MHIATNSKYMAKCCGVNEDKQNMTGSNIELMTRWSCLVQFQTHAVVNLVVSESDMILVDCVPWRQ